MNDPASQEDWIKSMVEQYEGRLIRYALGITGNLESARDVVQDVLIRLWEADRGEVENHVAAWLFAACRNRALDFQRKERRMRPISDEERTAWESREASPDQRVEALEAASHLGQWMARLPGNQQEVLRLKFQDGLSYAEISQVTRLSVSNVGFLLHTALKTLRRNLYSTERVAALNLKRTL